MPEQTPHAPDTPTTEINGEQIQTVEVTATRLMDWPKFLLAAAIFAGVIKLLSDDDE